MADDGSFRVIAAITTSTVQDTAESQKVTGATAGYFGELLTGTILVRETMAPQFRVQAILKGAGQSGSLVADSHPDGTSRGLVNGAARTSDFAPVPGTMLQMMRTLRNGAIQQGIVQLQDSSLSGALMEYLQNSEQLTSVIAVAALRDHDKISIAGGYLVQLLPEVKPDALAAMVERLERLPSIESLLTMGTSSPATIVAALLAGTKYTHLEESPLRFGCWCSKERLLATLATLPPGDLAELIAEGKDISISCDYCGKEYLIPTDELATVTN